ncbi:fused MFS/spermidine synthase [Terriglobus sp.]|uniref:fused MFS/spermidine synthase n=1 Tax=Terriglobus sp. TaxID=1889013 RepID=UPI003AFFFB1A
MQGPYLSEHGQYVSLHFGGSTTDGVHATMDRTAPFDLVFSYTQIMAGFARFTPLPRTIGMLGLGGGSLAKHCYRQFPNSRIVVAEISAAVIALRRHFLIPDDDDDRFSVLHMDGAALLSKNTNTFDVILVDAFNEAGHLPHFATRAFYRECYGALTTGGTLVLNFSGERWRSSFKRLHRTFRGHIVLYQCPDGDNVIVFATKGPLPQWLTGRVGSSAANPHR